VLVRFWFVHPQSARARSARTRTNQKRLGKTPMDVRSCRMVRVDFIWVWFVSGSFWFVLVRAGSFSLFFVFFSLFFNPLAPARARTRTNQKRTRPKSNPLAPGGIIEHPWLFYLVFVGVFWFVPSGRERIDDSRTRKRTSTNQKRTRVADHLSQFPSAFLHKIKVLSFYFSYFRLENRFGPHTAKS
jgi:hypothetical protein